MQCTIIVIDLVSDCIGWDGVAGTVCLCGVIWLKQQSQQRCCLSVCKIVSHIPI